MARLSGLSLCVWILALMSGLAQAAHGDYLEAMRVRALIAVDPDDVRATAAEEIRLPVSRGYDQGSTSLCWSYATLNGLETNYLVRHPGAALALSRRAMQYYTMEDRWVRKITGVEDFISERGVSIDAMRLLQDNGLVAFADFTDIDDPYGRFDIAAAVSRASGEPAKLEALGHGLAVVYGVPPETTHLGGEALTRAALAEAVLEGQTWESYAIARDGREGWRQHPDPDARTGGRSYFMPAARIQDRIKAALKAGYSIEITIGGHCILIYGASWDAAGKPVTYFIKDSYPDYFYASDPASVMRNLVEMSTAAFPTGD